MLSSLSSRLLTLAQLTGWRRHVLAFCLGICATLTLPPVFAFPLIVPAYAGLFLLLRHAPTPKRAFWDGWWWGWGHHMTALYWFCIALLTDPVKFGWLIPFTLFGLMGVIAIYPAIAAYLFYRLRLRGLTAVILFAYVWMLVEYARSTLLSGFPWNLPGYAFNVTDSLLQSASLVGIYGVSLFTVLLGVAPAAFFDNAISRRRATAFTATLLVMLLGAYGWGAGRLQQADKVPVAERYVPGVKLRLVQADIEQAHKWDPKRQFDGLQQYMTLTQRPGLDGITHVIWPETSIPYITRANTHLTEILGSILPKGTHLLAGTLRDEGSEANWRVFNSLMVFNYKGEIVGAYDKAKLVPFGEFLPGRFLIPPGWKTPVGDTDFSSGPGMQTLEWPGLPGVSPLICYEVIYPERAVDEEKRPGWLLSITNDAWFGRSSGPYQHMEMARMRAVEQGVPLVRVANTGITVATDAYGRIEHRMGLGQKDILDIRLNKAQPSHTIYSEHKKTILLLLIFAAVLLIINQSRKGKN